MEPQKKKGAVLGPPLSARQYFFVCTRKVSKLSTWTSRSECEGSMEDHRCAERQVAGVSRGTHTLHTYSVSQKLPDFPHLCIFMKLVFKQTPKPMTRIYGWYQNFTDLTCLSSINLLESQRYVVVKSIQVPHTYSVSQTLPSYVSWWRITHPKITRVYGYMPGFHYFYALNFRPSAAITGLCRIQVHSEHSCTLHIMCLRTTCVSMSSSAYNVTKKWLFTFSTFFSCHHEGRCMIPTHGKTPLCD